MNNDNLVIASQIRQELSTKILEEMMERATQKYAMSSRTANTWKAYKSDWIHFSAWCEMHGFSALPSSPEVVISYIDFLAEIGIKASTIQRRISAISQRHQMAKYEPPTKNYAFREIWSSVRKQIGTAQKGKEPVRTDDLRAMVNTLQGSLLGIRDRALLLMAFAGAFRRSEVVSLNIEDVEFTRDGLIINLRKSKTDQEGAGRRVGIPFGSHRETCPVRSLQDWIEASNVESGALFRSVNRHGTLQSGRLCDKTVALVVKRCAKAAGLDATNFSGHSLVQSDHPPDHAHFVLIQHLHHRRRGHLYVDALV